MHAFAWSADGTAIYYAVTAPLTHEQEEAKKADWKDVVRYREQHRGDLLLKQAVAPALAKALTVESPAKANAEGKADDAKKADESATTLPADAEKVAKSDREAGPEFHCSVPKLPSKHLPSPRRLGPIVSFQFLSASFPPS